MTSIAATGTSGVSPADDGGTGCFDVRAVRAVVERYFQGHAGGDGGIMRTVFWPTARIEGHRGGEFLSWTLDEYCARFHGTPESDEPERNRTVDFLDVHGDAAVARATLVHGETTFIDYLLLLRRDGTWRIAGKAYTSRRTRRDDVHREEER